MKTWVRDGRLNRLVALVLAAFVVVAACSDDSSDDSAGSADLETADVGDAGDDSSGDDGEVHSSGCPFEGDGEVAVSASCIDPWPLSVDDGTVYCAEGSSALVRTSAGLYALNGTAMTAFPDLDPLEDIWRENPDIEGTRINISPLTDIALSLC